MCIHLEWVLTNQFYRRPIANCAFFHYSRNKSIHIFAQILCPHPFCYTREKPQHQQHAELLTHFVPFAFIQRAEQVSEPRGSADLVNFVRRYQI